MSEGDGSQDDARASISFEVTAADVRGLLTNAGIDVATVGSSAHTPPWMFRSRHGATIKGCFEGSSAFASSPGKRPSRSTPSR